MSTIGIQQSALCYNYSNHYKNTPICQRRKTQWHLDKAHMQNLKKRVQKQQRQNDTKLECTCLSANQRKNDI